MEEVELVVGYPSPFNLAFEVYLEEQEEEETFRCDEYDGDYLDRKYC